MVPLLNEENTIFSYVNNLINELNNVDPTINPNIILIDDASSDRTLDNLYIHSNCLSRGCYFIETALTSKSPLV